MQRKFCITAVCMMLMLSGCHRAESDAVPVSKQIAVVKESVTEPETEPATEAPTLSIAERAENFAVSESSHIYDECGAFSEQELETYDNYLEWLSDSRLLCTAVVLTEHLDGQTPELFAQSYYLTLFGEENPDGFLVLINNDTYQDIIYTAGTCQKWIAQSEIRSALAQATPALIEKRYADALERLLIVGENVPAFVFDRTDTLTAPEQMEFSQKAQQVYETSEKQCALLLISLPEKEPETIIKAWKEKINADVLLIIDAKRKMCRIEGTAPDSLTDEILNIWEEKSLPWGIRHFFEKIQN